jgi:hypothetical protein
MKKLAINGVKKNISMKNLENLYYKIKKKS